MYLKLSLVHREVKLNRVSVLFIDSILKLEYNKTKKK